MKTVFPPMVPFRGQTVCAPCLWQRAKPPKHKSSSPCSCLFFSLCFNPIPHYPLFWGSLYLKVNCFFLFIQSLHTYHYCKLVITTFSGVQHLNITHVLLLVSNRPKHQCHSHSLKFAYSSAQQWSPCPYLFLTYYLNFFLYLIKWVNV